jgi:hypothetical protein
VSISARLIDTAKARQVVANEFAIKGIPAETALQTAIAEYCRNNLCLLSRTQTARNGSGVIPTSPIHILTFLGLCRRQLKSLVPKSGSVDAESDEERIEDIFRLVLNWLCLLREVIDLGNGYYLPAPLRFVDVGEGNALVIAGLPSADIVAHCSVPLAPAGICRTVLTEELPAKFRTDSNSWQSLEGWSGQAATNLQEWTNKTVEHAQKGMTAAASTEITFEVYCPDKRPKEAQHFRWMSAESLTKTDKGVKLCRTAVKSGPRRYFLGNLDGSRNLPLVSETAISQDDFRRLQYGFDLKAGAPETGLLSATTSTISQLQLRSPLPKAEERLIRALALQDDPLPHRLPMNFRFMPRWRGQITKALEGLSVRVREEKGSHGLK